MVLSLCSTCCGLDMLFAVYSLSRIQLFATPWTITRQFSSVLGILQARILEWADISFSSGFGHMPSKMRAFQEALVLKNLTANAGHIRDMGSSPGLGIFSGGGHGNPVHYSCLETDGGAWWATVRGVTKSWARLSDFTFTFTVP